MQLGVNPDTHTMDLNQDNQDPLEHHTLTIIPFGASYVNVMAMIFIHDLGIMNTAPISG